MIQFQTNDYVLAQWFFELNPKHTKGHQGVFTCVLVRREVEGKMAWVLFRFIKLDNGKNSREANAMDAATIDEPTVFDQVDKAIAELATHHEAIYDCIEVRGGPDRYCAMMANKPYMGVKKLTFEEALEMCERGELSPEIAAQIKAKLAAKSPNA